MLAWMEAVVNLHLAEQDDRNVGAVAFADPGAGSESGVMFFRPGDEVVMRPGCLHAGRYGRVAVGLGLRPFFRQTIHADRDHRDSHPRAGSLHVFAPVGPHMEADIASAELLQCGAQGLGIRVFAYAVVGSEFGEDF